MRRARRGSGIPVDPLRVRQARLEAGLSLAQVAGDDVSRTFIHFVEQGRSRPSQAILTIIARRTGKPIDYFLARRPSDPGPLGEIADELLRVAARLRPFAALQGLTAGEREGMKLLEATLKHGARLVRAMQGQAGRASIALLAASLTLL